ncbi:MAG: L,D-transpeptidase [Xenococcaceae cyanobacterium]
MLFRLTLASLGCIIAAIHMAHFNPNEGVTKQTLSNPELSSENHPSTKNLLAKNKKQWNSDLEKALAIKAAYRKESGYFSSSQIPPVQQTESISPVPEIGIFPKDISELSESNNYIMLTSTGAVNKLENPLYQLQLYANGKLLASYKAVTGRAYTQNRNRHRAGTEAPLPEGKYKVAYTTIAIGFDS